MNERFKLNLIISLGLVTCSIISATFVFVQRGYLQLQVNELRSSLNSMFPQLESSEPRFRWHQRNLTYSIENIPLDMNESEVIAQIAENFSAWEDLGVHTFTYVVSDGDIRISWERGDQDDNSPFVGTAYAIAYAVPPYSSGLFSRDGDIHLNGNLDWCLGTSNCSRYYQTNLYYVVLHEIGHALGLTHIMEEEALMWPVYSYDIVTELTDVDIQAYLELYN